MSRIVTAGELAAAAVDAAGAVRAGLDVPINAASLGAATLAAALGIIGRAAAALSGLLPPAALLTPQGAAIKVKLSGIAIGASAAQLAVQRGSGAINGSINDVVNNWNSLTNDIDVSFGDLLALF